MHNKITCAFDKNMPACDAPLYIAKLDDVFEMTYPIMGRTDIIGTALQQQLGKDAQFVQVRRLSQCHSVHLACCLVCMFDQHCKPSFARLCDFEGRCTVSRC